MSLSPQFAGLAPLDTTTQKGSGRELSQPSSILHILQQISQYMSDCNQQAYLVGGSLRNILLGEPCIDWDIVTDGDAPGLARVLADKLGGHYVYLHEKASRVVVKYAEGEQETIIDISPLMGSSIEEDLHRRDFTINAMAVPLAEIIALLARENVDPDPRRPQGSRVQGSSIVDPDQRRPQGTQSPRLRPSHHSTQPPPLLGTTVAFPQARLLHFIDPLNGLADIEGRRLKAVNDGVFQDDPLRMLRAVRLMMRYQLRVESATEDLIIRDAHLLLRVAPERVHDEFYAILEPDGATGRLRYLDRLGLLTVLIPEFIAARGMRQPSPHYWDVLEHSLESVGALERLVAMLQSATHGSITNRELARPPAGHTVPQTASGESTPLLDTVTRLPIVRVPWQAGATQDKFTEVRTLLYEAEEQGVFRFADLSAPRMKLAALLHDIGKPLTYSVGEDGKVHFYDHPQVGVPLVQQIMTRLNASTQECRLGQLVTAHHMRPGQLARVDPVTPRAIRRYFVDLGPIGICVALFSLADHLATLGPQALTVSWERHLALVHLLLLRYIRQRESILPSRLLSAEELMRRLKLEPGPLVGRLLEQIAEAQAEGRVHSKEEALWLAEERLHGG